MLSNLFVPMFQDPSFIGRVMSFIMRAGWVLFGSVIMILLSVPLFIILVGWLVLPVVSVLQICRFIT